MKAKTKELAQKVISLLRDSDNISRRQEIIEELEANLAKLDSPIPEEKEKANENIKSLCHVKNLGDLYIQGVNSWAEWVNMLGKLATYVEKE